MNKIGIFIFIIGCSLFIATGCSKQINQEIRIEDLRCELRENPSGIDLKQPRLSWMMTSKERGQKQLAYQILVASSQEKIKSNTGDVWDSKRVNSERSENINYQGKSLVSNKKYYWKVRVWDKNNASSEWSDAALWSTGFFDSSEWKANWIGYEKALDGDDTEAEHRILRARMLRNEFTIEKEVEKVTAFVCGLGLFELYLNGKKIGDQVLAPALSEYDKRVYYMAFDVTKNVLSGENAVGTILGNGRFFAPRTEHPALTKNYGFPKAIVQINVEFKDGTSKSIISDENWKLTTNGPIRKNNEYDGEYYDARLEMEDWSKAGFNDEQWINAELVEIPAGKLVAQPNEAIRIIDTVKPVKLTVLQKGVHIFDMGQNMVGWVKLKVKGKKGDKVTLRFSETVSEDGNLYLKNIRGAEVTDTYILKGEGTEIWEPRFTYHGFRFVEVIGYPGKPELSAIEGQVIHDDMDITGGFSCSNPLINQIYKNAFWGIRGNYRSIPTDCPQRDERHGWLGDRSTESKGESYIFNNGNLYRKWMIDVDDAQLESGSIPDVAPSLWPLYTDNTTWPGSFIIIPDMLYQQFGDLKIVEQLYPSMKKWIEYMTTFMENGTMPKDTYGDWCVPPTDKFAIHSNDVDRITAGELIGSCYFYHELKLMQNFATLLSKENDAEKFAQMADELKVAFNNKFLDEKLMQYSNNSQTSSVLPLAFGMVPEKYKDKIFDNLTTKILGDGQGHIGTGLIGSQWIMRVLTDNGRPDIAYTIAAQNTYPSWGYMAENGATTIWELWNGNTGDPSMNSHNHVMLLGDLIIWFYENLAGIKSDPEVPAFKHIIMKPEVVFGLDSVNASYQSVYGKISSAWKVIDGKFNWKITIPANTTATVYVPAVNKNDILEGGQKFSKVDGVRFIRQEDKRVVLEVQSGSYSFSASSLKRIETQEYVSTPKISPAGKTFKVADKGRVQISSDDPNVEIRYTTDSSTPDKNSKKYENPIEIEESTFIRTKAFKEGAHESLEENEYYDFADTKVNGLEWKLYSGKFVKVPDFTRLNPVKSGKVLKPLFDGIGVPDENFALQLNGLIDINEEGAYNFYLSSNDGSLLYIDDKLLIDNDGEHGATERSRSIKLSTGKHKIRIEYFQGGGGKFFMVMYDGPNIMKRVIPASVLSVE